MNRKDKSKEMAEAAFPPAGLNESIRRARISLSGMSRGEDKHPSPYGQGYVKGWRDCLRIFEALRDAQVAIAETQRSSHTAGPDEKETP